MATRADLNNNPTNIKVPAGGLAVAQQRYGDPNVSIDPTPAQDGGNFLRFSSPDYGAKASTTLLTSPVYSGLTVDQAMKKWSGGGYGGDVAPAISNKTIAELTPAEIQGLTTSMAQREGYTGQGSPQVEQPAERKYSLQQFGEKIQQKYWQYANLDPTDVAKKVIAKYPQYQNSVDMTQQATPTADQPTVTDQPQEPTLGQQMSDRLTAASEDLAKAASGSNDWFTRVSGLIQAAGEGAGAIGDITTKALELIPGVKGAEKAIGGVVAKAAQTPVGQSILSAAQDFAQKNPELAKDIGAGFNIATAIPILKGIGVVKDIALTGSAQVLKNWAEKGVVKGIAENIASTKTGMRLLDANGGLPTIEKGVAARLLPEVENGKYVAKNALAETDTAISSIEEGQLQPALAQVAQKQNIGQSLTTLENKAIEAAKADTSLREAGAVPQAIAQIQKRFEGWRFSYGENIDLQTENQLKRGASRYVDWGTPQGDADYVIRSMMQKDIEDVATKNGITDVAQINAQMGDLLKWQKLLSNLDGKTVKVPKAGIIRKTLRLGAKVAGGAAGEAVGGLAGVPIVGAYGGATGASIAERGAESLLSGSALRGAVLKRTATGASKGLVPRIVKKTVGIVAGSTAQQLNK